MELLVDLIPLAVAALDLAITLINRKSARRHAAHGEDEGGIYCDPCNNCSRRSDARQSASPSPISTTAPHEHERRPAFRPQESPCNGRVVDCF